MGQQISHAAPPARLPTQRISARGRPRE
jgi:hypothetical protein